MSYAPISGFALQIMTQAGDVASDYYIKLYEANTTTPLSMATDESGATTLVKAKLNDNGMPISNPLDNNTVFIPHVNKNYRLVIYLNETDADNNATASSFVNISSIPMLAFDGSIKSDRYYMAYGGTTNDITLTSTNKTPTLELSTGMEFRFKATVSNTASTTINVDGLGAKTAKNISGENLTAGYIRTDIETRCYYDGTDFIIHPVPQESINDTENDWVITSTTLNTNSFAANAVNNVIATGFATSTTTASFYFPIMGKDAPASISVTNTFNVTEPSVSTDFGSGVTPSLSSMSTNKLAVLTITGLSGLTTNEPVILRSDAAASKIDFTF